MRHLFYLHNLPLPDKVAAQKKIKNKIPARLYIYFPYGEISKKENTLTMQQLYSPFGLRSRSLDNFYFLIRLK